VYENKLSSISRKNHKLLSSAKEKAWKSRDAKVQTQQQDLIGMHTQIRRATERRKKSWEDFNKNIVQLNVVQRQQMQKLLKKQKKMTAGLTKRLKDHLAEEAQRLKRLHEAHVMIANFRHRHAAQSLSESQMKLLTTSNKDQRDMMEPRISITTSLKEEWEVLAGVTRRSGAQVDALLSENKGLTDYLRNLECRVEVLRKKVAAAEATRKELRIAKAKELVYDDRRRTLKWKTQETRSMLNRARRNRETLQNALHNLMEQIRAKRKVALNILTRQLENIKTSGII